MVKGFNEAWRNSGRKESEISIRYQYEMIGSEHTYEALLNAVEHRPAGFNKGIVIPD